MSDADARSGGFPPLENRITNRVLLTHQQQKSPKA
jgi:hypothetical protein